MPIVSVSEATRKQLLQLQKLDISIAKELLRVSLNFIRKGRQEKVIAKAAAKLSVPAKAVEDIIDAISIFLTEVSKQNLSDADITDSIAVLKLAPEESPLNALLKEFCLSARREVRDILKKVSFDLPHYQDIEWRLDVELGSRCIRNTVAPFYLVKIRTTVPAEEEEGLCAEENSFAASSATVSQGENGYLVKENFVEIDPLSLKHITAELERAVAESKTASSRRVMRNIK